MDERMFFAKTGVRANTGNRVTQITAFQGDSRTQKQFYSEMQGTGREQVTFALDTKKNDQSRV